MAVTNGWGKGAQNNTNGWGKSGTNNIGYGAIYESSAAGDTSIIGTSAAFLYSKSSYNQGEADPTPTITGTAGGSFNASANVVFVDTGTFNSSTGQIDLSATSIGSHIITYTVNGVQSGQTVGVTAVPYASTSSFTFDGVDDYFDTSLSALSSVNQFSISMWLKQTDITAQNYYMSIGTISSGNFVEIYSWQSRLYLEGSLIPSPRYAFIDLPSSVVNNTWFHLTLTFDSSVSAQADRIKAYFNAVNEGNIPAISTSFANNGALKIGDTDRGSKPNFSGNMDEVSIWNTTLSQDAVTEIYNSGAPNDLTTLTNASNTNLKAWYKF